MHRRKRFLNKLQHFYKAKRSLIAFNIQNVQQLHILKKEASKLKVPVIAQFSSRYISIFNEMIGLHHLVEMYQDEYLTFHLDHCTDFDTIEKCIMSGFASVMFDGSSMNIDENIKKTNAIYEKAHSNDCLLEAELGSIGGVEDGIGSAYSHLYSESELLRFSREANFDLLALAIGNAHGHYQTTETINVELLNRAKDLIGPRYFVLHGGTGMPDDMINRAIGYGVVKVNISTALKAKYFEALTNYLSIESEYNENTFLNHLEKELSGFYSKAIKKFSF